MKNTLTHSYYCNFAKQIAQNDIVINKNDGIL